MEKSLEQLKQEYEKTTVLLEREKRKMQRLKNRQAYLESGSRKQRTHRLITRGAAKGADRNGILFPHGKHFESAAGGAFHPVCHREPRPYFRAGERR